MEFLSSSCYIQKMDKDTAVHKLLEHRAELEGLGVVRLSVFGSTSRGDQTPRSDVDVAVTLDPAHTPRGLSYIGRLDAIAATLRQALGAPVDVVPEPARRPDIQAAIERDRLRVY